MFNKKLKESIRLINSDIFEFHRWFAGIKERLANNEHSIKTLASYDEVYKKQNVDLRKELEKTNARFNELAKLCKELSSACVDTFDVVFKPKANQTWIVEYQMTEHTGYYTLEPKTTIVIFRPHVPAEFPDEIIQSLVKPIRQI